MPLGLVALNSDVLSPADGDTVAAGPVEVRGYAFAGGERHVARVDVSLDGGSLVAGRAAEDLGLWAWRHWAWLEDGLSKSDLDSGRDRLSILRP
jgi:sulfite oxidase